MSLRIAIKIPPPDLKWAPRWGDTHFAHGLARALERCGHKARVDIRPHWYKKRWRRDRVVIQLRGLYSYKPNPKYFNVLWVIYPPDEVPREELEAFDLIFFASRIGTEKFRSMTSRPVNLLMQCTDPERFYPDPDPALACDLLFLGNTRHVYRPIVRDVLPTPYDLHVWGHKWEEYIPSEYIKGKYFPNEEARRLYSSCRILLNDHHDDMREHGILNNRIYDGLACGALIISDSIQDDAGELADYFIQYSDRDDLNQKIKYYLDNPEKGKLLAEAGRRCVLSKHTFDHRARQMLDLIETML